MEDQACPKCKTTVYRNPNMKLMVNVCGHNLCESCVELLFVKGSGSCPECGIPLRRNNFRIQLFEDASIDKEVDIRKRILKDFNKKEEDFETLRDYNDYLEMVEDIIFNLTHNIDILETNKRIAEYKEKNRDFINKNRHKKSKELLELEDIVAEEAKMGELRLKETQREEEEQNKTKSQNKEKLIDDLMFSDTDASEIVSQHKQALVEKASSELPNFLNNKASKETRGKNKEVKLQEAVQFNYIPRHHSLEGPKIDLDNQRYIQQVRAVDPSEKAGGFNEKIPCSRALEEAMCGLFF